MIEECQEVETSSDPISKGEKIKNFIFKRKAFIFRNVLGNPGEKVYCIAAVTFGILAIVAFPATVLAKSQSEFLLLNNMPIPLGPNIPRKNIYNYAQTYFSSSEWLKFIKTRKLSEEFHMYLSPLCKPTAFFVLGSLCTAIYGINHLNGAKRDNLILDSMIIECYEDNMKLMAGIITDLKGDL